MKVVHFTGIIYMTMHFFNGSGDEGLIFWQVHIIYELKDGIIEQ